MSKKKPDPDKETPKPPPNQDLEKILPESTKEIPDPPENIDIRKILIDPDVPPRAPKNRKKK